MTTFLGMIFLVLRSLAVPSAVPQTAQIAIADEPVIIIVN